MQMSKEQNSNYVEKSTNSNQNLQPKQENYMQRFKTISEFDDAIETIMANYYSITKEELQERVCVM